MRARQLFSECGFLVFAARAEAQRCERPGSGRASGGALQLSKFARWRARLRAVRRRSIRAVGLVKRRSRGETFSSKRHARVGGSFITGSWSALGAVHREQGPLAAIVRVSSASVGGVLRSSLVVARGLYGLGSRTFRTFLGRASQVLVFLGIHARRLGAILPPPTRRDRRHQRPTFRPPIPFLLFDDVTTNE